MSSDSAVELYLSLLKCCLLDLIYAPAREAGFDAETRRQGRDWPAFAHTMIGLDRLNNLQVCLETVVADNVPGDCIETGVWRGGAAIFMRGLLKAYRVTDRCVWVADSFEGLPSPDLERYPQDASDIHYSFRELAVPLSEVSANFERYGLLDDQVRFVVGWFHESLPIAPIERLAVLRLDGDMYGSTMDSLVSLYPRLSAGGYVIVDDYGMSPACAQAVHDYRAAHGIAESIQAVDWTAVYWRRAAS